MSATKLIVLWGMLALFLFGCAASKQEQRAQRVMNMSEDVLRITQPEADDPAKEVVEESAPPALSLAEPLTLEGAIEYSLTNNLEALAMAQEKLVQDEMIKGAWFRALPQLILQAETHSKSTETPSSSISYRTRRESLEPSVSEDNDMTTASYELSWDILNLATSVFRTQQEGMRSQVIAQQLRRIKQNVALEVTESYMRASMARDLADNAVELVQQAEKRQEYLDKMYAEDLVSKNEWLQNRIDIKEMMIRLASFEEDFASAKALLAELLGVMDQNFEIAGYDFKAPLPDEDLDQETLEAIALKHRPELYEKDFDEKIAQQDLYVAIARMFPSVTPFLRGDYTSNSYYLKNEWYTYGLRVSWDLLNIPEFIAEGRTAARKRDMEMKRRLQLTLAVLTQLRLALLEYKDAGEKLPMAKDVAMERGELMELINKMVRDGKLQESLLLEESNRFLTARQRYLQFYKDMVVAQARIKNSVGLDWQDELPSGGSIASSTETVPSGVSAGSTAVDPTTGKQASEVQEPPVQASEPAKEPDDLTVNVSAIQAW